MVRSLLSMPSRFRMCKLHKRLETLAMSGTNPQTTDGSYKRIYTTRSRTCLVPGGELLSSYHLLVYQCSHIIMRYCFHAFFTIFYRHIQVNDRNMQSICKWEFKSSILFSDKILTPCHSTPNSLSIYKRCFTKKSPNVLTFFRLVKSP